MYDELLLCAKARQRDLWQEAQHNALVRRASADRPTSPSALERVAKLM